VATSLTQYFDSLTIQSRNRGRSHTRIKIDMRGLSLDVTNKTKELANEPDKMLAIQRNFGKIS
jgi:hypothetical protein